MTSDTVFLLDTRHDNFFAGRSKRLTRITLHGSLDFWVLFVHFLGLLGMGIYFLSGAVIAWNDYVHITQDGQDAQVTVLSTETIPGSESPDKHLVTFRFVTLDRVIINVLDVSYDTFKRLTEGSLLEIRYWKDDPTVSLVKSEMNDVQRRTILQFLGGAFLLVLSAFIMIYWLRRYFKVNRLALEGHLIEGQVVGASGEDVEGDYMVTLKYKYCRQDGTEVQNSAGCFRNDLKHKSLPQVGTKLAILYISDDLLQVL